jgi:hypothetical protein
MVIEINDLPDPGKFVDDDLVTLFDDTIKQLHADMGRRIILYLPPSTSGCPNCKLGFDRTSQGIYDPTNSFALHGPLHKPFPNGGFCPVCKGTHEIKTVQTVRLKALIQRNPKDLEKMPFGKDIDPRNVYLIKTTQTAWGYVNRAEKVLVDGNMCVKIRDPVQTGLRDLNFTRSWWMKTDK